MSFINEINQLPSIKNLINDYEIKPLKKLGQNFILDLNITNNIAKTAICLNKDIIEIGPGPGGLTRSIFIQGANSITAIEKDNNSIRSLKGLKNICGEKLHIIHNDVLNVKLSDLGPFPKSIIANLPYNISSKLIISWLKEININKNVLIDDITITIQRELADKIVCKTGESNYGRISLITNLLSEVKKKIELPPSVFFPKPNVYSSVIKITPLKKPRFQVNLSTFEKLTKSAFGNRRKMLRQSLKLFGGSAFLRLANIDDKLRAQDLSTYDFCKLSNLYDERNFQ